MPVQKSKSIIVAYKYDTLKAWGLPMKKSDLIQWLVKEYPNLSEAQVKSAVNILFQSIVDAVAKDDHVELRGFGSFTSKQHNQHIGRNPKTGERIAVDAKRVPFFKPGKILRESGKNKF